MSKGIVVFVTVAVILSACGGIAAANLTVSANREYSISYVLNGGVNYKDNPVSYRSWKDVEIEDPTYEGYVFIGWYTDPDLKNSIDSVKDNNKGDMTLYAGWEKSLIGTYLFFDITGNITQGNDIYPITGNMSVEYKDFDKEKGYNICIDSATVTDLGTKTSRSANINDYWDIDNEDSDEYILTGTQTIDTVLGPKTCDVWNLTKDDSTDTQYIDGDGIVYLIESTYTDTSYSTELRYELKSMNDTSSTLITKEYAWTYKGNDYSMSLDIAFDDLVYYRADNISRKDGSASHDLRFVTYEDKYIGQIAQKMEELTVGMSISDRIGMVLAFTQYVPYMLDKNSTYPINYWLSGVTDEDIEYWKYPVETLIDGNGDCEDTSILFCAIAKKMGYDCCLIIYNDHMAAGVYLDGYIAPHHYTFNWKPYYYCETTATGWNIGDTPNSQYRHSYDVLKYVIIS